MSRHQHDADCTPDALERIADQQAELIDRLERIIAIYEMTMLTDEQRYRLQQEREAVPS